MMYENNFPRSSTQIVVDTSSNIGPNIEYVESQERFKEICKKLDISDQLVYLSIKDYTAVKSCFILQGDQKLWLICALYGLVLSISNGGTSICTTQSAINYVMMEIPIHNRKANTPNYTNAACTLNLTGSTVNVGDKNVSSNVVVKTTKPTMGCNNSTNSNNTTAPYQTLTHPNNSESNALLSNILCLLKINVNFFFSKFNNWMRMIDLPKHVTQLVSSIEMSGHVTYVMFKKYMKIFPIFYRPPDEYMLVDLKGNKRKTRKRACDSNELFHFCWFLFVATKELTSIIYDISIGFHLLLQCVKFAYINIVRDNDLSGRLLVQHFIDNEDEFNLLKNSSVLDLDNSFYQILAIHDIQFVREQADLIFQRTFIPAMEFIKQQNQFLFNFSTYKSALEPEHITNNLKYLIELYRDYRILHFGVDEMDYVKLLYKNGMYVPLALVDDTNTYLIASTTNTNDKSNVNSLDPFREHNMKTPLSKKSDSSYTSYDDLSLSLSPVDYVMNLLNSVRKVIYNVDGSSYKNQLLKLLGVNSFNVALRKSQSLPDTALNIFNDALNAQDNNCTYYMDSWQICVDLYYKILYVTTDKELSKITHNDNINDVMTFLSSQTFHKSLLAICFDVFIFINNCQKPFPWISTVFDIEPFYLIQCIELVIKGEHKLPRVILKHLTILEEEIISYHGWISTSPIYSRLDLYVNHNNTSKNVPQNIPTLLPYFCNVKVDGIFDYNESLDNVIEPLYDRFDYMNAGYADPNSMFNNFCNIDIYYKLKPSFNKMIPSSVFIFYQKVYYIILTRLNDFGVKMKLSRGEKAIIWKCMEYLLVSHTYLMKDHHIDQLLVCSIYTILKVINKPVSFSNILQHYATQPQAKLSIYRYVSISIIDTLLHNHTLSINFTVSLKKNEIKAYLSSSHQRVNVTGNCATQENYKSYNNEIPPVAIEDDNSNRKDAQPIIDTSTIYVVSDEERAHMHEFFTEKQLIAMNDQTCDIIQFYNKIFSHVIQRFANEIAQSIIHKKIVVEPYPILKTDSLVSPLRISQNYSVYVSPMKLSNTTNHYNADQPLTPFINKVNNPINNSGVRFNLTNDKSPMVCREINRFIAETKRDHENSTNLVFPVKRRLLIDDDDLKKNIKTEQSIVTESRSIR